MRKNVKCIIRHACLMDIISCGNVDSVKCYFSLAKRIIRISKMEFEVEYY